MLMDAAKALSNDPLLLGSLMGPRWAVQLAEEKAIRKPRWHLNLLVALNGGRRSAPVAPMPPAGPIPDNKLAGLLMAADDEEYSIPEVRSTGQQARRNRPPGDDVRQQRLMVKRIDEERAKNQARRDK